MNYEIDLDPAHSVIRLTITAETMTMELAEEIYRHLSEATSSGGPYAAIYDLSAAKLTTLPTDMVRSFAHRRPSIPMGRKHVVVGKEPHIFGLALLSAPIRRGRADQCCPASAHKRFRSPQGRRVEWLSSFQRTSIDHR